MEVHQFGGGLVTDNFPTAADIDVRAKLKEARRHSLAKSGPPARDQNASSSQKIVLEHDASPQRSKVNCSID
jgi:hypothetical protein